MSSQQSEKPGRQYPAFYEKGVPIAIGLIIIAVIALMIIIFGVALGLF